MKYLLLILLLASCTKETIPPGNPSPPEYVETLPCEINDYFYLYINQTFYEDIPHQVLFDGVYQDSVFSNVGLELTVPVGTQMITIYKDEMNWHSTDTGTRTQCDSINWSSNEWGE